MKAGDSNSSRPSTISSYSIKALHYIGNVETQDRYPVGAPNTTLVQLERILAYEAGGGDSSSSSRTKPWTVISAVEYFLDTEKVTGSIPVPSTKYLTINQEPDTILVLTLKQEIAMNEITVEIRPATKEFPKFVVMIHEFKFDSIRQESYWVMKETKTYRLRSDAETFAKRFGWKG